MSIVVDGQTITSMPFSLREQTNSDPFNPGKKFVREGPFPDLAYTFRLLIENGKLKLEL